jgi:Tfp pilus assembly protein PilZ
VLSFTIRAPQLGDPIILRGMVRWLVQPDQARADRPAGMGIEFVFDSPAQKTAIENRLDRLMVSALGPATFEKLMGKPAPTGGEVA